MNIRIYNIIKSSEIVWKDRKIRRKKKDTKPEKRKSNIDAVSYTGRRHGRIMSLVADDVPRSTGQKGSERGEKDDKEGEAGVEKRKKAEISLFLLAPTVIPAKLKLPKEVSFASSPPPRQLTHSPYPTPNHLFRISCALHFGSASSSRQALLCLLPTNQPTSQELL